MVLETALFVIGQRRTCFLYIISILLGILFMMNYYVFQESGKYRQLPVKQILLWNPFFKNADYNVGFGTAAFEDTDCSKTCYITNDKNLFNVANAVVVHTYRIGVSEYINITLPKRLHPDQKFVFFNLESPLRNYRSFIRSEYEFNDLFNLTFTYMDDPDTDVYIPIGGYEKLAIPEPERVPEVAELKLMKKEMIYWLISSCESPSSRNEYANKLSEYIDLHIFGQCGKDICPKGSSPEAVACWRRLQKEHMFYLAFENSYCQDYITEKVYKALWSGVPIVPVVLGAGNYYKTLPPNSYIDVRDFQSPKHLAEYLTSLSNNITAYRQYFTWREDYFIYLEQTSKKRGFCKLCEILHDENYTYKKNFDALNYWNPERVCLQGEPERQIVHLNS